MDQASVTTRIQALSLQELSSAAHRVWRYIYFWRIIPAKDGLTSLYSDAPVLEDLLPFAGLAERLDLADLDEDGRPDGGIGAVLPELPDLLRLLDTEVTSRPQGIEKAESWLRPIAADAGAAGDIEAAVYFASRGRSEFLNVGRIQERWHSAVCASLESGLGAHTASEDTVKRASDRTLSLVEAAQALKLDVRSPRFFSSPLEDEDFIDAAMFRAVDWIGIVGFDPWLRAAAREISRGSQGGIDHVQDGWTTFHWARSDLLLRMVDRGAWETWIYTLANGPIERGKPWRTENPKEGVHSDYVPLAAILCFLWHRIKPSTVKDTVLADARELLLGTQMRSGAWPLSSDDSRPSLLATCTAIHALALDKPNRWSEFTARAARWIAGVQHQGGFWDIDGGPTVMLTVLALDSLELATGGHRATFRLKPDARPASVVSGPNETDWVAEEPVYDYAGMAWHDPANPRTASRAVENVGDSVGRRIAIAVATQLELRQVLRIMSPLDGEEAILKIHQGPYTYYVGVFGAFPAIATMSTMGTQGATGSTLAINALIQTWNPDVIVLTGIAFGRSRRDQAPADVLVADRVINYEPERVGEERIDRGQIPPCSPGLVARFRNALDWEFERPDGTQCGMHVGPVLSGEKLVADERFKNFLGERYPTAIGGEMEGTGLWSAASVQGTHWVLVKGVCDWGDQLKKDDYQEMAAASAVSLCVHVFGDPHVLDGL